MTLFQNPVTFPTSPFPLFPPLPYNFGTLLSSSLAHCEAQSENVPARASCQIVGLGGETFRSSLLFPEMGKSMHIHTHSSQELSFLPSLLFCEFLGWKHTIGKILCQDSVAEIVKWRWRKKKSREGGSSTDLEVEVRGESIWWESEREVD